MTCILDVRWCGDHGIGRFAREITNRLPARAYQSIGNPMSPFDPFNMSSVLSTYDSSNNWFLSPGYNAPIWGNIPYVLTVHDLNHIDRPENSSLAKRLYYRLILRRLCRRARAVLTVSEFSRGRIIAWMGLNPAAVFNVGNGVSSVFSIDGDRWTCEHAYVLCVSNRRGHKNEPALISAFAIAALPVSVRLVFTGDGTPELWKLAKSLGIAERMIFTGRVSEETLAALYRGAICLCFVSLYEGFGLPIVEAFASGTPVISANVSSMPEIAGDAALLVDPYNIGEIAQALHRLCEDEVLRSTLIRLGRARVAQFTWQAVADRIKAAIAVVNNDPRHPLDWI